MTFDNLAAFEGALVGLAVLAFVVVRQFSTRQVNNLWTFGLPLILAVLGLQGLNQLSATGWLVLGVNASLGLRLGLLRGMSVRVWNDARGVALMRGTSLTLILWLATIAVRIVLGFLAQRLGLGAEASSNVQTLLPTAITIAAQSVVVYLRAQDQRLGVLEAR